MDIEKDIKDAGLTAPRVTPDMLNDEVADVEYQVFHGVLTVCCITMQNGFMVTGESACASPENYDWVIGEKIAFANAKEKMWPLLGFRLKDKLDIK